ncbi:MAG: hypothetical protein K2X47_12100, partial [Bdellovibrionales bacterium]|nr:hypothetical protein [Bdellovibrionales bacterium]
LPGDIISKASHTMMIERLDKGWETDPFGMACWGEELDAKGECKNKKTEAQLNQVDCSKASPSHFRFDLIQSAGMDSKGYVRTPAYDFFAQTCKTPTAMNRCPTADQGGGADLETGTAMMRLAVRYCEARKSGSPAPKAKVGTSETTVGIIRHLGKKREGCMMPTKPKIKNDDCVNCKKGGGK